MKKIFALVLAAALCLGIAAGCTPATKETPLVVGYNEFSSKFSPFFSETAYDRDVADMTGLGLLAGDRTAAIIYKGIEGETIKYNGTDYTYYGPADLVITQNDDGSVYYDFTLREDLVFSDGTPVTIDDVIFTMYTLCDPSFDGSSTFYSLPIKGLAEYRAGMDSVYNFIAATKRAGYTANDVFTEAQYNAFWEAVDKAGPKFAQSIVDYCLANYASYGAVDFATSAALWGFEGVSTPEEFWAAIAAAYENDVKAAEKEVASDSLASFVLAELGEDAGTYQNAVKVGDSAENISGIIKTGKNTLRVILTEVDATAIYQFSTTIAPLHYYGDASKYDYENNKFGFDKGNLSIARSKTTQPMGAGPYKFVKFENGVVYFEANEKYFKGAPKTKYIQFREGTEKDKLNAVVTGTADITDPTFNKDTVKAIKQANPNGTLNGEKIDTNMVNNLGYGYVGMNASRVKVGDDKGSAASKNLRKAIATVIAVYRELSVDSYYGELASVINYPISDTSWAAPQKTDAGYKVAFSVDVNGNDIYTSTMTDDEKYAAALQAALGFFEAAGYTVEDGKLPAAPMGAKLQYECLLPADGIGDHPAFKMMTEASNALKTIGFNLIVTDLANSDDLWTALNAKQVDMWAAAWGAAADPDMVQIYFSGSETMAAGKDNYRYDIDDQELNTLILAARKSLDQSYRKTIYKQCLDIIVDWACEIPTYQRVNAVIFSTERVNLATVTPDITPFYGWMGEIQNTELVK